MAFNVCMKKIWKKSINKILFGEIPYHLYRSNLEFGKNDVTTEVLMPVKEHKVNPGKLFRQKKVYTVFSGPRL